MDSSFLPFLPARAIVMAKRRPRSASDHPSVSCRVLFIHSPLSAEAGDLLQKMIQAMGLSAHDFVSLGEKDADFESRLSETRAEIVVALGSSAAAKLGLQDTSAGSMTAFQEVPAMVSLDPSELIAHPQKKREAWTHLQKVASTIGVVIPKR